MPQGSTLKVLARIAEDQWGLVTRRQAENAGISRRTFDRLAAKEAALERVANGVYLFSGAPPPDHLELRAAWLQLAPGTYAWERTPEQGVISHRSAASIYGVGHLPADRHEFTLPVRKQSRRRDVRIHNRPLPNGSWTVLRGLPVTLPSRIVSDLLSDREDPEAVAQIVAEAIREAYDYPATIAEALKPHAAQFRLRRGDGITLLRWLLDLVGDPHASDWISQTRVAVDEVAAVSPGVLGRRRDR